LKIDSVRLFLALVSSSTGAFSEPGEMNGELLDFKLCVLDFGIDYLLSFIKFMLLFIVKNESFLVPIAAPCSGDSDDLFE